MEKQKSYLVIAQPDWFSYKFEIDCPQCNNKFCGDWDLTSILDKIDQNNLFFDHCCHCNSRIVFTFPLLSWHYIKKQMKESENSNDPVIIVNLNDVSDTDGLLDEIERELGE